MSLRINGHTDPINSFLSELQAKIVQWVQREIEIQLEAEVDMWLYRCHHERRAKVDRRSQAICQRCGTHHAHNFSRNGHRKRQLVTGYGVITFWLPRVVCQCGGSVTIPFTIIQPYQRLWTDVVTQVDRWARLGLSLRQMQDEIGAQMQTQVGLRKLNAIVHDVVEPPALTLTSVPPIIMFDAIWVTLLETTPAHQKDTLNRRRTVKKRRKVCVLVALGLYPQSQRWGILGWQLADSESQVAWETLLVALEARGVYRQRGVELIIHDGGKGLIAALNLIYPHIPHQRCSFHKLRNLWHAIQAPKTMSRPERIEFKKSLLQQVQPILYAKTAQESAHLRDDICQAWQATQPDFVATLKRDWHETIAFFRVLQHHPQWARTALRTTSLLERINRMLRRLFRPAGAYQSRSGLLAAVTRVLAPRWLI